MLMQLLLFSPFDSSVFSLPPFLLLHRHPFSLFSNHCALNLVLSLQIRQHFALKPQPERGNICEGDGGRKRDTKRQRALAWKVLEKSHPRRGWKGHIWQAEKYNHIFINNSILCGVFLNNIFFPLLLQWSSILTDHMAPLTSLIYACKYFSLVLPSVFISILHQFVFVSKAAFSIPSTTLLIYLSSAALWKRLNTFASVKWYAVWQWEQL